METRKDTFDQNEMEINLLELFYYLKKKIAILAIITVVCALAGFLVSSLFMTPQYTAVTRVYVLNRSSENAVVSSDFTLSNYMIADYKVLITGENVTKEVVKKLDLNLSAGALAGKISVTSPDSTRVLQISVTDANPQAAAAIANCVREVASAQIQQIMAVDAVNLIYEASVPTSPTSPNVMKNTILAGILGLAAAIAVFAVIFILDDTIRTEEDVEHYLGLSTMGVIPVSNDLVSGGQRPQNAGKRPAKG